ncbi:hypothetical protein Hanom_Chr03g00272861 [Helianthus anomalus]
MVTLKGLTKIDILHGTTICKLCGEGEEDSNHLFISCYVVSVVWHKVSLWCKIPQLYVFSIKELLEVHKSLMVHKL